jgi:hypothetical protein
MNVSVAAARQALRALNRRSEGQETLFFVQNNLLLSMVIENLEDLGVDEVIEQFDVTREQVTAVLEFVAESLRPAVVPAGAPPL